MKKIIAFVLATIIGLFSIAPVSVFAACTQDQLDNGCVSTNVLGEGGCSCDDGKGSSIMDILELVVDILTIGVGILGVVGISIAGVQYLTAGGSEEKTRKAKRRILEIVIGLIVYALFYAIIKWLGVSNS